MPQRAGGSCEPREGQDKSRVTWNYHEKFCSRIPLPTLPWFPLPGAQNSQILGFGRDTQTLGQHSLQQSRIDCTSISLNQSRPKWHIAGWGSKGTEETVAGARWLWINDGWLVCAEGRSLAEDQATLMWCQQAKNPFQRWESRLTYGGKRGAGFPLRVTVKSMEGRSWVCSKPCSPDQTHPPTVLENLENPFSYSSGNRPPTVK